MTVVQNVLVVAAHPDDEVLGCGGTLARLSGEGCAVHVLVLADGESSRVGSPAEMPPALLAARRAAARTAGEILGCASVDLRDLPDNRLDSIPQLDVIKIIEACIDRIKPATVFTHHGGDVNIDHRIIHEAVLAACRPQPGSTVKELYFFEVPSSTAWRTAASGHPFEPNRFVDVTTSLPAKLKALEAYADEVRPFPHARSVRAVEALARWRGATAGVEAAEAFVVGRQLV